MFNFEALQNIIYIGTQSPTSKLTNDPIAWSNKSYKGSYLECNIHNPAIDKPADAQTDDTLP